MSQARNAYRLLCGRVEQELGKNTYKNVVANTERRLLAKYLCSSNPSLELCESQKFVRIYPKNLGKSTFTVSVLNTNVVILKKHSISKRKCEREGEGIARLQLSWYSGAVVSRYQYSKPTTRA